MNFTISCRARGAAFLWMLCAMGIAPAAPQAARTAEFSAEIVSRDAVGSAPAASGRIYVANRVARIETPEAPGGYFLVDAVKGTAVFVLPSRRIFMDAKRSSRLTQVFVPIDAVDPCQQWRAAAALADMLRREDAWRCEPTGEKIAGNGRAIGYRVASDGGESSLRWVDPDLLFPVKQTSADGTMQTLENIQMGTQPADLFAIPPGFHHFDPQALIDRVKHSDAWVDP
jgi:hypothetical protein